MVTEVMQKLLLTVVFLLLLSKDGLSLPSFSEVIDDLQLKETEHDRDRRQSIVYLMYQL